MLVPELRDQLQKVTDELWSCHSNTGLELSSQERQAIEPLLDQGFSLCDVGSSRVVVQGPAKSGLDRFALKLGRYGNTLSSIGMAQNKTEVQVCRTLNKAYPIAQIHDWDEHLYRWVVMDYGTPLLEKYDSDAAQQKATTIAKQFESCPYIQQREITASNCIERNGTVELADYGILPFDLPSPKL